MKRASATPSSLAAWLVCVCFASQCLGNTFSGSNRIPMSQQDKNIQMREGKLEADARYEAACNRLANKAVQRGSADNVTVMVVRIEH